MVRFRAEHLKTKKNEYRINAIMVNVHKHTTQITQLSALTLTDNIREAK